MAGHGKSNVTPTGPDIGWIPLSGKEFETPEALGAVVFNRSRQAQSLLGACRIEAKCTRSSATCAMMITCVPIYGRRFR